MQPCNLQGVALHPYGSEEMRYSRLSGSLDMFGISMHVLAIQVGYGPVAGPFALRESVDNDDPGECIGAADPEFEDTFLDLHRATGSAGHLETVFVDGREYAVFVSPFSK